jgi:transcriptional regulator with XRE-family HTH domain
MEVKIDSSYIREQRERRAWSQEHLAEVTGLGLRTIQRIEKTGAASYESARSLAAVFGVDVADLRAMEAKVPAPPPRRLDGWSKSFLGAFAALVTGGALLYATQSVADQVLVDVSTVINRAVTSSTGVAGEEVGEWKTQFVVDDGTLVPNVNDLRLKEFRFSIVPHVQDGGRILLEIGVFEQHGNEEIVLGRPRLIALDGETAEVAFDAGGARTLRIAITPQVNPPELPPTLHAR